MLDEFVTMHRDEIIRRCRAKVASRSVPPPTAAEIDHGVPLFLDQLVAALRLRVSASVEIGSSALLHGHDLRRQGFTVSQVVHDYGDVCQSITELAVETNAPIGAEDFRILNACLDNAIASAVTQFGRERRESDVSGGAAQENERLGYLTHELRNLMHTALMAFEIIKTGNVGVAGSTGMILERSLLGARDLIVRSLNEVRLTEAIRHPVPFPVRPLIDEIALAARLSSDARGVNLRVLPVDAALMIAADRTALAAAVTNVLQNAFKFTRPRTTVTLSVISRDDRVLIEVQDECGGLTVPDPEDLFLPFEQSSPDRTGLGLGLAYSRWAVEASRGRIDARTLPGVGCVFSIDLPRHAATVVPSAPVSAR